MKKPTFAVPVTALLIGAALGFCLSPSKAPQSDAETSPTPVAHDKKIADAGSDEAANALRKRVRELEALLKQAQEEKQAAATEERVETPQDFRPRSPREMFERMRTEDPERFAQMTNNMARFRRDRLARAQSKIDFLESIDTSTMSTAQLKTHEALQNMIARREEIEAKMHNPDLSDEERHAIFEKMHAMDREIRELNASERTSLLSQTAEALGYTGDDAEEIVATITEIISATESGRNGPPGPPPTGAPLGPPPGMGR